MPLPTAADTAEKPTADAAEKAATTANDALKAYLAATALGAAATALDEAADALDTDMGFRSH